VADEEAPKIIIDEDWKSKVEREKEETQETGEQEEPAAEEAAQAQQDSPFVGLVSYFASNAMGAMGMFAPKDAEEVPVNLELAQFIINALMTLREKTQGNLTPEETGLLNNLIGDLQQSFVVCSQAVQESALRNAGAPTPNIQTP